MRTPFDVAVQGNIPDVTPNFRETLKTFIKNAQLSRQIANENIERHLEINKTRHDNKAKDHDFEVGYIIQQFLLVILKN